MKTITLRDAETGLELARRIIDFESQDVILADMIYKLSSDRRMTIVSSTEWLKHPVKHQESKLIYAKCEMINGINVRKNMSIVAFVE